MRNQMLSVKHSAVGGFMLVIVFLSVGCHYTGVGQLTIDDQAADDGGLISTDLTGTFDRYLSREDGDVFTFVAYQKMKPREKFGQYYRNYKKDAQFVQAELTVRVNKDGQVIGQPRLLLRQGDRVLTDGVLQGDVSVATDGSVMSIAGDGLNWRFKEDATSHAVSFDLTVHNIVKSSPPTEV